jgi:hypothetical protein
VTCLSHSRANACGFTSILLKQTTKGSLDLYKTLAEELAATGWGSDDNDHHLQHSCSHSAIIGDAATVITCTRASCCS